MTQEFQQSPHEQAIQSALLSLQHHSGPSDNDTAASILAASPEPACVISAAKFLLEVLLPGRRFSCDDLPSTEFALRSAVEILGQQLELSLRLKQDLGFPIAGKTAHAHPKNAAEVLDQFLQNLGEIRGSVVGDIQAAYRGDPAALSYAEVKLAYPGIVAVCAYRVAHQFYQLGVPIIPRIITEWAHSITGIDIHPGAKIGPGLFIDHGTGVVIGETAQIGKNVKMYQGAILGAKSFDVDEFGNPVKQIRRHPTVEDDVIIYSNAIILGGDTVIGKGSIIGGSVFLTKSVPPNSLVLNHSPELLIREAAGNSGV